jgi:predicted tellurium resistance membrane protein TerC
VNIDGHEQLLAAIKTILIADLVMSLDNVIAVAAWPGKHDSAPRSGDQHPGDFGSTLLIKVMERFPIVITVGAALTGSLPARWW